MNNTIQKLESEIKQIKELSLDIYSRGWIRGCWDNDDIANQFYDAHKKALALKEKMRGKFLEEHRDIEINDNQLMLKIKQREAEVRVTSNSYERARKIITKEVHGFLCH